MSVYPIYYKYEHNIDTYVVDTKYYSYRFTHTHYRVVLFKNNTIHMLVFESEMTDTWEMCIY